MRATSRLPVFNNFQTYERYTQKHGKMHHFSRSSRSFTLHQQPPMIYLEKLEFSWAYKKQFNNFLCIILEAFLLVLPLLCFLIPNGLAEAFSKHWQPLSELWRNWQENAHFGTAFSERYKWEEANMENECLFLYVCLFWFGWKCSVVVPQIMIVLWFMFFLKSSLWMFYSKRTNYGCWNFLLWKKSICLVVHEVEGSSLSVVV